MTPQQEAAFREALTRLQVDTTGKTVHELEVLYWRTLYERSAANFNQMQHIAEQAQQQCRQAVQQAERLTALAERGNEILQHYRLWANGLQTVAFFDLLFEVYYHLLKFRLTSRNEPTTTKPL